MSQTYGELLRMAAARLKAAGVVEGAAEARRLLSDAAGLSAARLGAELGESAAQEAVARFEAMLMRREAREPVSHILGKRQFFNHEFVVTAAVLDPRPETEMLVLAALEAPFERVLDLGTGSGAILLSLLAERSTATGLGTDLSPAALKVAQQNAKLLELEARCRLEVADWFTGINGCFDLIVSNPPYISQAEMAELAPELSYEPAMALTDGSDGMKAYRAICAGMTAHLAPGGRLIVEIGWTQGAEVAMMMQEAGLCDVRILPDLDGRDRVVLGSRSQAL